MTAPLINVVRSNFSVLILARRTVGPVVREASVATAIVWHRTVSSAEVKHRLDEHDALRTVLKQHQTYLVLPQYQICDFVLNRCRSWSCATTADLQRRRPNALRRRSFARQNPILLSRTVHDGYVRGRHRWCGDVTGEAKL